MRRTLILCGLLAAGAGSAIGVTACGNGGSGGGASASGTSASGTTSSSSATGSGSTGSGTAGTPDCMTYCTDIVKNCVGGDGSAGDAGMPDSTKTDQQYSGMAQCMASCKAFPVGAIADTSGNTLGCRQYHAHAAAMDAKLHCPQAGPGGDGVCGTPCEGYCEIAMTYCTDANMAKVYTDAADCAKYCGATADDVKFNVGTQSGNHVACLLYHAQEGSVAPKDHCTGDLHKDPTKMYGSVTCL